MIELAIVLVPGFSNLCLASLIEPLRVVNALSGAPVFRWRLIGSRIGPVMSASGVDVLATTTIDEELRRLLNGDPADILVVCAGEEAEQHRDPSILQLLRAGHRRKRPILALGTATFILAHAGLLVDRSCTVHWPKIVLLSEVFFRLDVRDALYVSDGIVTTCAGEFATFDLVMDLIRSRLGEDVLRDVSAILLADRHRSGENHQSAPLGLRYGGSSDKLIDIIRLMERRNGSLSICQISSCVGLSRRQVERLFRQHLGTSPLRYYRRVWLERARQFVKFTNMPIIDIAVACGFETASHFSREFRRHFGIAPSLMRKGITATATPRLRGKR